MPVSHWHGAAQHPHSTLSSGPAHQAARRSARLLRKLAKRAPGFEPDEGAGRAGNAFRFPFRFPIQRHGLTVCGSIVKLSLFCIASEITGRIETELFFLVLEQRSESEISPDWGNRRIDLPRLA